MHPNQNFTPLKLFKKHTIESDTYIDSPLAPPTLSNRSQIVKTKDSQKLMQTSTNNQTSVNETLFFFSKDLKKILGTEK